MVRRRKPEEHKLVAEQQNKRCIEKGHNVLNCLLS